MAYCAMPSKVLVQFTEHRPVGDPSQWQDELPTTVHLAQAGNFRDLSEMLSLTYTAEVAA